jgi:hypothetical protein
MHDCVMRIFRLGCCFATPCLALQAGSFVHYGGPSLPSWLLSGVACDRKRPLQMGCWLPHYAALPGRNYAYVDERPSPGGLLAHDGCLHACQAALR